MVKGQLEQTSHLSLEHISNTRLRRKPQGEENTVLEKHISNTFMCEADRSETEDKSREWEAVNTLHILALIKPI